MKITGHGLFAAAIFFVLHGCSQQEPSSPKDLSVSQPGSNGQYLFWSENQMLIVGKCAPGLLAVRENCGAIQSMLTQALAATVNERLSQDLQTKSEEIDLEIQSLRDKHPVVIAIKADLKALADRKTDIQKQKDNNNANIMEIDSAIEAHKAAIVQLMRANDGHDVQLAYYDEQIAAAKAELANSPQSAHLQRLLASLEAEKTAILDLKAKNIAAMEAKNIEINRLQSSLAGVRESIATLDAEKVYIDSQLIPEKQELLRQHLQTLSVDSDNLQSLTRQKLDLRATQEAVPGVFDIINAQDLTYRDSLLSATQREVLKRIAQIFPTGAAQNVPVNVPNLIKSTSGYVQIFHKGSWRGICDDSFDESDARVLCRMMGPTATLASFKTGIAGQDSFWIDDLACTGQESDVFQCHKSELGARDCGSSENVQVQCHLTNGQPLISIK